MSNTPKFEVTVYPSQSGRKPKSSILYGFPDFESIAKLYSRQEFSLLNINTGEYRCYANGKNIGVFF